MYRKLLKPLLFLFDPETVHDVFVSLGEFLGRFRLGRWLVGLVYGYSTTDASLVVDGIRYKTPVLLAAGFDYNGRLAPLLGSIAFGGAEVGSVTARPCEGNPKPRLKRLIQSGSLMVFEGLRNDGVDAIIQRLRKWPPADDFVLGISIARTNDPQAGASIEAGIEDYYYSLKRLVEEDLGHFYTINVSCPNVHGGESFADVEPLDRLLAKLSELQHNKPVYVKLPINLPWDQFAPLLDIVTRHGMTGVVIGNLNKDYDSLSHPEERPPEYRGGLSGKPCSSPSTELIRKTRHHHGDSLTIIGCGGIFSAEDALEKIDAGANLVQLITGMIFEGPHLMKDIAAAYAQKAKHSIEQA